MGEINLTHAIVCQYIGSLKDSGLAVCRLDWRERCHYNQDEDYVFASPDINGKQPLWPSSAMSKLIRPAAKRSGIQKHVRWHVFRHSFATLLKANGEDVKTVQEPLRYADSKITLDTYTQGLELVKRAAQQKVFEMIGPGLQVCKWAIKPAIRTNQRDRVLGKAPEVLPEEDVIATFRKLASETVFHAEDLGIPDEVGDAADHLLVMRNEEAVAVDRSGVGIERIGLAVEPTALGVKGVDLTFQRDIIRERPADADSEIK